MADPRTHVLWLAKGLGPGGMERLLVHHARVGDRHAFRYSAAYVVDRPHSVVPELVDLGVEVHQLDAALGPVGWARSLRRLVRDEHVDVVHVHSPALAAVARGVVRMSSPRPRMVSTEHNSWDCYSLPTRLANVATYPLDDHRFAVSADAIGSVPRPLRGRSEVLVHGIDPASLRRVGTDRAEVRAELDIDPAAPVVLVVANHRAEKAWDVLLRAARQVVDVHPDAVFLGVGHGQLESEHRALAEQLGLGSAFRILGFRDDVARLFASADVFALSSRQEGLPVAMMEAMAYGLPIVATAVGGLPDAVESGVSGLLVPPEDPVALASALSTVIADDELRVRLAAGAAAHADAFDIRRAVEVQERCYAALLAAAPPRR